MATQQDALAAAERNLQNARFESSFPVHAVTFERPLSDPKPAFHATDLIGRFWPITAVAAE